MLKESIKAVLKLFVFDLIFLILFRLALISIPHQENSAIYYLNINFHFIIACLIWANLLKTRVNRTILIILGIWPTAYLPLLLFYILTQSIISVTLVWITYHVIYIYISSFQLFITFYLFFLSLYPSKKDMKHVIHSLIFTMIV